MKNLAVIVAVVTLSGCLPIRVVKDMPPDGNCEKLAVLDAYGSSAAEVRKRLEQKAGEIGGNLLLFNPNQPYEVTLTHPAKSQKAKINGIGVAYKCTYQ